MAPGCAAAAEQLVDACCPAARRRTAHWRAGADGGLEFGAAGAAGTAGAAVVTGAAGSARRDAADDGGGEEAAHLSFAIPQQQADLPALFAALEEGRWVQKEGRLHVCCRARASNWARRSVLLAAQLSPAIGGLVAARAAHRPAGL